MKFSAAALLSIASVAQGASVGSRQAIPRPSQGPFELVVTALDDRLATQSYLTATNPTNPAVGSQNMVWTISPWQANRPQFLFVGGDGTIRVRGNDTLGAMYYRSSAFAPSSAKGSLWPLWFTTINSEGFTSMGQFSFDPQTSELSWGDKNFWACRNAQGVPEVYHSQDIDAVAPGCWKIKITQR